MNGRSRAGERRFSSYRKAIRAVGVSSCCSCYVKFGMCIWDLMRIFMCSHLTFTGCSFQASQGFLGQACSHISQATGSQGTVPPLSGQRAPLPGLMEPRKSRMTPPWSLAPFCSSPDESTLCSGSPGTGIPFLSLSWLKYLQLLQSSSLNWAKICLFATSPHQGKHGPGDHVAHVPPSAPGQPLVLQELNWCKN